MKKFIVFLVALFIIGGVINAIKGQDPEVRYKVIHVTNTKTKHVKTPVYEVPQACLDAADLSAKIERAAVQINKGATQLLDIMSATRIAVFEKNSNALNDLETESRRLNARTVASVQLIGETKPQFKSLQAKCERQVP